MIILLSEGLRMFRRRLKLLVSGFEEFDGKDDEEICRKIIESCYDDRKNKQYFRTSVFNYPEFYARDFGWCIESLINLGYKDKVRNTIEYALDKYSKFGKITVVISPNGKCFDFPNLYSPDSVAYMFRSLRILGDKSLIIKYGKFLKAQIEFFEKTVIDEKTGIVKNNNFSGMRDYEVIGKSCYDMIMAVMLHDEIEKINKLLGRASLKGKPLKLNNSLKKHNLKNNLIKYYWNSEYFKDSSESKTLTGHCNVYPYWLDVINSNQSHKMRKSSILKLIDAHYDKPIPLKYGQDDDAKFIWHEIFVMGWERETSWSMLGLAYIDVVSRISKKLAIKYLNTFKENIIDNKSFIEVHGPNGKPYKSMFYASDTSMLWAAMYLDLKKRLKVK